MHELGRLALGAFSTCNRAHVRSTSERRDLTDVLEDLGDMVPLLRSADPTQRARFYEAVRLTGTYDPAANRLHLSTSPGGDMVRLGDRHDP